jgi:hypothetical protein
MFEPITDPAVFKTAHQHPELGTMTPDVTQVNVLDDYCIEAKFANGEARFFDMRPLLDYPAFVSLKDINLFKRAHVSYGTVGWDDEIDLSPDTLYLCGVPLTH